MINCKYIAFLLSLGLVGCGAPVISSVTAFYNDALSEALDSSKTFYIYSTKDKSNQLEAQKFKDMVSLYLSRHGFKKVSEVKEADYQVGLAYGVLGGRKIVSSRPVYGSIGGGTTSTFGTIGGSSFNATSTSIGSIGQVGTRVQTNMVYPRYLQINIYDRDKADGEDLIFEGKVKSSGSSGVFNQVGGCLVSSLLQNFPGDNGKTVSVKLPFSKCDEPVKEKG